MLRRLNHPNICGYKESFLSKNKDSLCIVMEFCDGGDLSDVITRAKNQLFRESKILHYFVQMSLGLQFMHSNRILHRDLKTQNIFLLGNGRLVLGDLGICKVLEGTTDFAKTCIGEYKPTHSVRTACVRACVRECLVLVHDSEDELTNSQNNNVVVTPIVTANDFRDTLLHVPRDLQEQALQPQVRYLGPWLRTLRNGHVEARI